MKGKFPAITLKNDKKTIKFAKGLKNSKYKFWFGSVSKLRNG